MWLPLAGCPALEIDTPDEEELKERYGDQIPEEYRDMGGTAGSGAEMDPGDAGDEDWAGEPGGEGVPAVGAQDEREGDSGDYAEEGDAPSMVSEPVSASGGDLSAALEMVTQAQLDFLCECQGIADACDAVTFDAVYATAEQIEMLFSEEQLACLTDAILAQGACLAEASSGGICGDALQTCAAAAQTACDLPFALPTLDLVDLGADTTGSDESTCDGECADTSEDAAITEDLFACDDGQYVPASWVCDGEADCASGADEAACR